MKKKVIFLLSALMLTQSMNGLAPLKADADGVTTGNGRVSRGRRISSLSTVKPLPSILFRFRTMLPL